ncbi:hypothetical protein KIH74_32515 [Kineosporia sp. J2-2]|uniref:Uncharacterized protein n=1 Tax=Kineosporia corallincola TaxID=2835133 RepID=A0ABS5TSD7_9ACTN|nr:hypothetical protein [Kineosporia corallincola]MBT0773714.1 hypothetical protein [Kineosporia corallincola]
MGRKAKESKRQESPVREPVEVSPRGGSSGRGWTIAGVVLGYLLANVQIDQISIGIELLKR